MKVVYIGDYRSGSGYAHAILGNIIALDKVDVEVVPRYVPMNPSVGSIPERILELENGDTKNVNAVIQHNLPSEWDFHTDAINVGCFAQEAEGKTHPNLNWEAKIEKMNKVLVPSEWNVREVVKTTNQNNVHAVPHVVDTKKFNKIKRIKSIDSNTLNFYYIGTLNYRKNIVSMVWAYFRAFDEKDNVALYLKTNEQKQASDLINHIKKNVVVFGEKRNFPKVYVLPNYMTDEDINRLHVSCDVCLSTSYGESFGLSVFDALGCGNMVVVPKFSSFTSYISSDIGDLIPVTKVPCFGGGFYSDNQIWGEVDILSYSDALKSIYEKPHLTMNDDISIKRINYIDKNMSYKAVGNKIIQVIGK